jgi:hypothetical protein
MDQGNIATPSQLASQSPTIVIIDGVAGDASCAARHRWQGGRLRVVMHERGPCVSFANSGLPNYNIGRSIEDEAALLIADVGLFRDRFNVYVRELARRRPRSTLRHACSINTATKLV